MIAGVTNKEVAGTDGDPMRISQLPRPTSYTTRTGYRQELAFTRIKAFQLRILRIEQIDAAVRSKRDITRRGQATEASTFFRQGALAVRCESQHQRLFFGKLLKFARVQLHRAPSDPTGEEPRGWIVRRAWNRWYLTWHGIKTGNYSALQFDSRWQTAARIR